MLLRKEAHTITTLENLYYGNIAPHEYEVERGSEYDVTAKLTEQQKAILEKPEPKTDVSGKKKNSKNG